MHVKIHLSECVAVFDYTLRHTELLMGMCSVNSRMPGKPWFRAARFSTMHSLKMQ